MNAQQSELFDLLDGLEAVPPVFPKAKIQHFQVFPPFSMTNTTQIVPGLCRIFVVLFRAYFSSLTV